MIRFSLANVISACIWLSAAPALADVAPTGGCGGRHSTPHPPPPCTAQGWSTSTGLKCVECAGTDTACSSPLLAAGYTVKCVDVQPAGEVNVLCPSTTGQAEPARDHLIQLAGLFALLAVLAGVRVVRTRV
jgi:hypothetical protein